MTYSEQYFGKKLNDLDYSDIEIFFIEPREETETIEFKSGAGDFENMLHNIIPKVLSSFLNSSGGILVWGSPQEKWVNEADKSKGKICSGSMIPVNTYKEKDSVINKILGRISYMPSGISLKILTQGDSYIYVFEIRESEVKPLQSDGRYYIRLDGQCKPAPHYLVDALFKQVKIPNLEGYLRFLNANFTKNILAISVRFFIFNFTPTLNEKNVSADLLCSNGNFRVEGNPAKKKVDKLVFGRPWSYTFTWTIEIDQLDEIANEVSFILSFMGDNSPAKVSEYKLNLRSIQRGNIDHKTHVTCIRENRTLIEIQAEIGHSKEENLRAILGR